jgi:tryptophanyl-tRNA synthetase
MSRLSGIRPTGRMHLGHYFSVIRPALDLDADVLIAEYHAPRADRADTDRVFNTLMQFGLSEEAVMFQSDMFDAMTYFRLLSVAHIGELERMTQYRAAKEKDAHLLVYPVLMVHDVMGYQEVIVGEDQTQHLNYARDLIARYDAAFGTATPLPVARPEGGRVMSLSDPTKKMSKSEPDGCLFLDDSEDDIRDKVRAAVMDVEGRANLIGLYGALNGQGEIPLMNSVFKPMLADRIIETLAPARAVA